VLWGAYETCESGPKEVTCGAGAAKTAGATASTAAAIGWVNMLRYVPSMGECRCWWYLMWGLSKKLQSGECLPLYS